MQETTYSNDAKDDAAGNGTEGSRFGRILESLFGNQRDKLKDPFYLLVLLGFISQGFFWENAIVPVMLAGLWFLLIFLSRRKYAINETTEILFLLLALLVSIHFGRTAFMRSLSFGNGLLILQSIRMLRPLSTREKCLSAGIAIVNIAVGSQMMLEYGFILVLAASLVLILQTFHRLEAESCGFHDSKFSPLKKWKEFSFVVIAMITFFLVFPRYRAFSSVTVNLSIGRNAPIAPTLDPASGGMEGSGRLIFQISGEDIGYLKTFTLDTFDGTKWTAGKHATAFRRSLRLEPKTEFKYRKATVKEIALLGGSLPADGYPVALKGNFFQDEYVSWQGNIRVSRYWPADNNTYEYWTDLGKHQDADSRETASCLSHPEFSARTKNLIAATTANAAGEYSKARALEKHLRDNFAYEIGTYDLNRLNPLDDFLFNEKRGHCERFASALALLFRQMGIPSRIAIGFVPVEKNELGGFFNIRDTNAHAWVEAYLPDHGWTVFDATPVSDRILQRSTGGLAPTMLDWIEFVWYQKIVGFTSNDQVMLYKFTSENIEVAAEKVSRNSGLAILLVTGLLALTGAAILFRRYSSRKAGRGASITYAEVFAEHFYRDLLRDLASAGIRRAPSETPGEILRRASDKIPSASAEMTFITEEFCKIRYGGREPEKELHEKVKNSLFAVKLAIKETSKK
ncbi:MAG: transglutaminaseTgpA domain-containing protein [Victivallales bacterium]